MKNEKRSLRRIDNKYGVELKATLIYENDSIVATILDYNSLSVSIQLTSQDFQLIVNSEFYTLQLQYGNEVICEIQNPFVVRTVSEKCIFIFNLRTKSTKNINRNERVKLSYDMQGTLSGIDPFSINQSLVFHLHDISRNGFAAISSKSNRHLTPGLKLIDFNLAFPGKPNFLISCMITNISENGNYLKIGCRFTKISKALELEIERAFILNKELPTLIEIDQNLRSKIKKIKKFEDKIRIRRSTSMEEYEKILHLRFIAYKNANKVYPGQTWKNMADEYDENSIIYVAYVGQTLAATMRLVFPNASGMLPFQDLLPKKFILDIEISKSAEISKFAIDPHLQGTDLFFEMFKNIIFEIGAKGIKYPVCLATRKLSLYYKGIGAKEISSPIPHPTIKDETLTLLLFDPDSIIDGKMPALGWFLVARPALKLLRKFHFVRTPSYGISKYFTFPIEIFGIYIKKLFQRSNKIKSSENSQHKLTGDKSA